MIEFLSDMVSTPYWAIVLLTLVPALELRAAIPYGVYALGRGQWPVVFALAVVTNIALGPVVYILLDRFLHLVLKIKFCDRLWQRMVVKTQKKIHAKVQKYGVLVLGLFIGVPLPGSGVYSGAAGGYVLGFSHRDFFKATVLGVIIAGVAVLLVTLLGGKMIQRLFIKQV